MTSRASIYQRAWDLLHDKIKQGKTGWGKNELRNLMADCLEEALREPEPGSDDVCKCGHKRMHHIEDEGACRPGFECQSHCSKFHPSLI